MPEFRGFFLEESRNMLLYCFSLQTLADPGREKAGIIMMIIVLNKLADCSLPFTIIFGKYLALASVRSFQYCES